MRPANARWRAFGCGLAATLVLCCYPHAALAKKTSGPVLGGTMCLSSDISPSADACKGWYEGNLDGGSKADNSDTAAILNSFLGTNYTSSDFPDLGDLSQLNGASVVNFGVPLWGETVVSFHVGGAKGQANGVGYEGTAFYQFNAGNLVGGLEALQFKLAGLSNARLYSTGDFQACTGACTTGGPAPEPSAWWLMLLGVGAIGSALRMNRGNPKMASELASQ
jgi:PEP-CTERM motif